MAEGLWWWATNLLQHYWVLILLYVIPIPVGMYIAYWKERQGESSDSSFDYAVSLAWPIALAVFCIVLISLGIRFFFRSFTRIIDFLILISIRRLVCSDETGELWRAPAPNADKVIQWVKVQDKTGTHWIQVPPNIKTAREGVAWTYSMDEKEYHPDVRT